MKILATKERKTESFHKEQRAHSKCTFLNQANQTVYMQVHMHVFVFDFLSIWMLKRKFMHKSEFLFKWQISTSFFSKSKKWRQLQHLTILKWILVLDTRKLQIQTKSNSNRIIDHQQQSNSFLGLKSTLATISNQRATVRLCYFCKGEL